MEEDVEVFYLASRCSMVANVMKCSDGQRVRSDCFCHRHSDERCIVRCVRFIAAYMHHRQVRNAARVIGNPTLYRKMEATSQLIKRDIVFAASLYVA